MLTHVPPTIVIKPRFPPNLMSLPSLDLLLMKGYAWEHCTIRQLRHSPTLLSVACCSFCTPQVCICGIVAVSTYLPFERFPHGCSMRNKVCKKLALLCRCCWVVVPWHPILSSPLTILRNTISLLQSWWYNGLGQGNVLQKKKTAAQLAALKLVLVAQRT